MSRAARIAAHTVCLAAAAAYVVHALSPHEQLAALGPLGLFVALTLFSFASVGALGEVADAVIPSWDPPRPTRARFRARMRARCVRRGGTCQRAQRRLA